MWFLCLLVLFVAFASTSKGSRLRPWVIGISLIVCGFALHAAFEVWVADWAGRFEMGSSAILEAVLFLPGLWCVFVSLLRPGPLDARPTAKVGAWVLWLVTSMLTALAVLDRLPS